MAGGRNTLCKCCIVSILEIRDSHVHETKFSPVSEAARSDEAFCCCTKEDTRGCKFCPGVVLQVCNRDEICGRQGSHTAFFGSALPSQLKSLIVFTHWLRVRGEARLARSSQAELYMYFWGFPSHANSAVAHLWFHVQYLQ